MIYGHISAPNTYAFLLTHPLWKTAFDCLKSANPETPSGIHKLLGDKAYVSVQGYQTVPPVQNRYETHRRYIDLQYCITGGELIESHFTDDLEPDGAHDPDRDVCFYRSHPQGTMLRMSPGTFAIFFPSEAHAPKLYDGTNTAIFKAVVKIDRDLE